jgi:hypothetical protein
MRRSRVLPVLFCLLMTDDQRLSKGYRHQAERHKQLAKELAEVSAEATEFLGESPEWDEES